MKGRGRYRKFLLKDILPLLSPKISNDMQNLYCGVNVLRPHNVIIHSYAEMSTLLVTQYSQMVSKFRGCRSLYIPNQHN
jgi:hypothetical protein